jgi:hypothetical protein
MPYYNTENSKIEDKDASLFDIKTIKTTYGRDLDVNIFGSTSRIIGLDKLIQQVEKSLAVYKGKYSEAPSFGLTLNNQSRSIPAISTDIKESLNSYRGIQQENDTTITRTILGKNIYRSTDLNESSYWKKLNTNLITSNTYTDDELIIGSIYFYAITDVYVNSMGETKETDIVEFVEVEIPQDSTQDVVFSNTFFLTYLDKSVRLFWNLPVEMDPEEKLNTVSRTKVTLPKHEPRSIFVELKLANENVDEVQLLNII